jgi:hypothetical protein
MGALDEAALSRFYVRAVLVSGMGFFTDATSGHRAGGGASGAGKAERART